MKQDPGPQGDPYEDAWNEGETKPEASPVLAAVTEKAEAEKAREASDFSDEWHKPDSAPEVKAEPEPAKPTDFKSAFAQAMAKKKAEGGPDTFTWNGKSFALKYKDKAAAPAAKPAEKPAGLLMPKTVGIDAAPVPAAPVKRTAPTLVERNKDLEDKLAAKGEGFYGTKKSAPAPEVNPVMGKSSVAEAIPKHAFMGKGS